AMSDALVAAAGDTGIRLTLLPVLYMTGGFDGRPLGERQKRFGHDVDGYLRLFEALYARRGGMLRVGCALHSLRAVPEAAMREVVAALPHDEPSQILFAEWIGVFQDCVALRDLRQVEWPLHDAPVDARLSQIHATHLNVGEGLFNARTG